MENLERVQLCLDLPELLCQLAEECDELGHAALKLRRAITGTNPTPTREVEARNALIEEIADVFVSLDALGLRLDDYESRIWRIWDDKLARWAARLEERYGTTQA